MMRPNPPTDVTVFEIPGGIATPLFTTKWWGFEETYYNAEYCSKRLVFNEGGHTSMHFHIQKHETLYVAQGKLHLQYVDPHKETHTVDLPEGSAFVIPPGLPHKLIAKYGKVVVLESSTYDHPNDSIRIWS